MDTFSLRCERIESSTRSYPSTSFAVFAFRRSVQRRKPSAIVCPHDKFHILAKPANLWWSSYGTGSKAHSRLSHSPKEYLFWKVLVRPQNLKNPSMKVTSSLLFREFSMAPLLLVHHWRLFRLKSDKCSLAQLCATCLTAAYIPWVKIMTTKSFLGKCDTPYLFRKWTGYSSNYEGILQKAMIFVKKHSFLIGHTSLLVLTCCLQPPDHLFSTGRITTQRETSSAMLTMRIQCSKSRP